MDDHHSQPRAARSQSLTAPSDPAPAVAATLTEAGRAALDSAAVLARNASAPATLRAYRVRLGALRGVVCPHGLRTGAGRTTARS